MKKRKWLAMNLAGGKGTRLNKLTNISVKPALPFGNKYHIADLAFSNWRNFGIETVGILTRYKLLVLHAHLANDSHWNESNRNNGVTILSPYQRGQNDVEWDEKSSQAVYQKIEYIEQTDPNYVLVVSANQVYRMDYSLMFQQHIRTNADCTIAVGEVP